MLDSVYQYIARGWYVIPLWWPEGDGCACGEDCGAIGKHPIAKVAPRGLKNATRDEAVVALWWGRYPRANVGIVTGPESGLAVVDVDSRSGGELSMDSLETAIGRQLEAPTVVTGGGGYHLYYKYEADDDIPSRAHALGTGIDIKGRGGYVVAPPSMHASGKPYSWDITDEDVQIERFPADLRARLDAPQARAVADDDDGMIGKGERNSRLFALGAAMRRHGVSMATLEQVLQDQNAARCVPPVSAREVGRIAASCASYAPSDPLLLTPHSVERLWEAAEAPLADEYCLSIMEYAGDSPPASEEDDFWISGLVPKAAPMLFAGPPKSAKSLFVLDLCIALARGDEAFLGRDCRAAKVLFLPLEDPRVTTQRRIWQLCVGRGIKPEELEGKLAIDSDFGFYFDQSKYIGALNRAIDKFEPDVIVVDSLARAFVGDENSKESISKALSPWQDLVRDRGVTVAAIHHFKKSTVDQDGNPMPLGLRLRGSGDLFAFVRQVVGISAMGPRWPRCSTVETSGNYETQVEPFAFRPVEEFDDAGGWPLDGRRLELLGPTAKLAPLTMDDREAAIHELLSSEPMSGRALREALSERGKNIAPATLTKLLERMGAEQVGGGRASIWRLRSN